jgi:hypothetical protein
LKYFQQKKRMPNSNSSRILFHIWLWYLLGLHRTRTRKICQNRNLSQFRKQLFTSLFTFNIDTQLLVYCPRLKFDCFNECSR